MSRHSRALQRHMSHARVALNRASTGRVTTLSSEIPAPPDPRLRTARDVLVVHMRRRRPKGTGISHYEIHTAPDPAPGPRLVILTRDDVIYRRALRLEGRGHIDLDFHISKRPDGSLCYVADRLDERIEP